MRRTNACVVMAVWSLIACGTNEYDLDDAPEDSTANGGGTMRVSAAGTYVPVRPVTPSAGAAAAAHTSAAGLVTVPSVLEPVIGLGNDDSMASGSLTNGGTGATLADVTAISGYAGSSEVLVPSLFPDAGCAGSSARQNSGSVVVLTGVGGINTNIPGNVYYVRNDSLFVIQALGAPMSGLGGSATCVMTGVPEQLQLHGCGYTHCVSDAECLANESCFVGSARAAEGAVGIGHCDESWKAMSAVHEDLVETSVEPEEDTSTAPFDFPGQEFAPLF